MPTKFSELPNIFRAKASAYLRAHDGAAVNRLTRFGAHGGALQRALRAQTMPLGFEVRNGPATLPVRLGRGRNESPGDGLNPVLLRSCVVSWDGRFTEPIVLPGGAKLASLREAIAHLVNTIPASERRMPAVLTAAEQKLARLKMVARSSSRGSRPSGRSIARLRASSIPRARTRIGESEA
jgi:hypothetical protein